MTATVSVSTPTSTRGHFRADIEGLRSVAVLLVVGSHLIVWPEGGFVGVDVFFVISGYLITGILIRQLELKGTVSFVDFYRRRFLRIVPAAVVVLVDGMTTSRRRCCVDRARRAADGGEGRQSCMGHH